MYGSGAERRPAPISADLQVERSATVEAGDHRSRAARFHDLGQECVPDPRFAVLWRRRLFLCLAELVPSSARSVSSAASPLPTQLVPLLQEPLDKIKEVVGKVLPLSKKRSALEEAEWEDVGGSEGALERELMMQSMETLRVYRPRVALHGPVGMGQAYIAAAALHHLEGYHVQSLDLGSLLADSTRVSRF